MAPSTSCNLACSLPLVKLAAALRKVEPYTLFEAQSESPGFIDDVILWCRETGNELCNVIREGKSTRVIIYKKF